MSEKMHIQPPLLLVVDDDKVVTQLFRDFFLDRPERFVCCTSVEDALEVHKTQDVKLIITDLVMPKMDGVQFSMRLRELKSSVPLVAMTGHSRLSRMVDTMSFVAVLYKPFSMQELEAILEKFL